VSVEGGSSNSNNNNSSGEGADRDGDAPAPDLMNIVEQLSMESNGDSGYGEGTLNDSMDREGPEIKVTTTVPE